MAAAAWWIIQWRLDIIGSKVPMSDIPSVASPLVCLKAIRRNPAAEKPAGPRIEIRHKPDTLDSVEQLGPRCAQPCYESFGDEGEKTLVPRQETKDGDELYCHDNLEQLSLLVCCLRCSLLHFRIIFQTLKTCAWWTKCISHKYWNILL